MCRNHSHITCAITGHLRVGESDMLEVRVRQRLVLDLPSGERWIKAPMTALWMPVSMQVPLPASTRRLTEVCFTPLYYTEASATMHGSATSRRQTIATPPGRTVWPGWGTSHLSTEEVNDDNDEASW